MSATSREGLAERKNDADGDASGNRVNPWKAFAGVWRENPDFDAFLKEIEDLRRESDQPPTEP